MKRYVLLLTAIFLLSACESKWSDEDKNLYMQSCMEDAVNWAATGTDAQKYCDCMIGKLMRKYPDVKDMMGNMEGVINDPDLRSCRDSIAVR